MLTFYKTKRTYLLSRLDFVKLSVLLTVEPLVADDLVIKLQELQWFSVKRQHNSVI